MEISNIKKTYNNKVVLDIDKLNIQEGCITAIIGANGSGKSTLGKILCGIIKADNSLELPKNIAYMPQENYAFDMSSIKNILLNSKDKVKDLERAKVLENLLEISDLEKQNAKKLSGGETSKMAIARILLNPSDIIILDEPTSAMDVKSILKTEELIKQVNLEYKNTIILITHSISQAERIANDIIYLEEGKILEQGPINSVLDNPSTESLKEFIKITY